MNGKVTVIVDELYPFFQLDSDPCIGRQAELSGEEAAFVEAAMEQFWKAQEILQRVYEGGR